MSSKKNVLAGFLCIFSILLAGALGALDFFGFLGGDHSLNLTLIIASVLLTYLTLVSVILLDFSDRRHYVSIFALASAFFGFTFFLINLHLALTVFLAITFFIFLIYAFRTSSARAALFIRFNAREIVGPVLRKSLLVLVFMFAAVNFTQTKIRLTQNNLITPAMVAIISKPFITTFNAQFSKSLQKQFAEVKTPLSQEDRQKVTYLVIGQTLNSMANKKTGTIYGIDPKIIPIEKTVVYENGSIDLTPAVDAITPQIAQALNGQINKYALLAPFIVAVLTILLLQPFLFIIQGVEMVLTVPIFRLLLKSGFIKKMKQTVEVDKILLD